jgi:hypothetical protein
VGHSVDLYLEGTPPLLGALIAVLTYHYYRYTQNRGNSGGHR